MFGANFAVQIAPHISKRGCLSATPSNVGGSAEIRTLEPFRVAGFQDRCLQPLGHTSNEANYKHSHTSCKARFCSIA